MGGLRTTRNIPLSSATELPLRVTAPLTSTLMVEFAGAVPHKLAVRGEAGKTISDDNADGSTRESEEYALATKKRNTSFEVRRTSSRVGIS